jgi:hypothetical protein
MRHTSPLAQLCSQSASVARKPLLVVTFNPPALSVRQPSRSPISANGIAWTVSPSNRMAPAQDQIPGFTVIYASAYDLQSRTQPAFTGSYFPVSLSDLGSTKNTVSSAFNMWLQVVTIRRFIGFQN